MPQVWFGLIFGSPAQNPRGYYYVSHYMTAQKVALEEKNVISHILSQYSLHS